MTSAPAQPMAHERQPRRNLKRWLIIVLLIPATVVILPALWAVNVAWQIFFEMKFSTQSAAPAVTQIMNHTLVPSAPGMVSLPWGLSSNSRDGHAYVTIDAAGTTWILFPTWRGKGDNAYAYVYCSAPAAVPVPATLNLNGPNMLGDGADANDFVVIAPVNANWYHVVFNLN